MVVGLEGFEGRAIRLVALGLNTVVDRFTLLNRSSGRKVLCKDTLGRMIFPERVE